MEKSIQYIGHIFTKAGVKLNPQKPEKIMNWDTPKNITEHQSFLGLCNR